MLINFISIRYKLVAGNAEGVRGGFLNNKKQFCCFPISDSVPPSAVRQSTRVVALFQVQFRTSKVSFQVRSSAATHQSPRRNIVYTIR